MDDRRRVRSTPLARTERQDRSRHAVELDGRDRRSPEGSYGRRRESSAYESEGYTAREQRGYTGRQTRGAGDRSRPDRMRDARETRDTRNTRDRGTRRPRRGERGYRGGRAQHGATARDARRSAPGRRPGRLGMPQLRGGNGTRRRGERGYGPALLSFPGADALRRIPLVPAAGVAAVIALFLLVRGCLASTTAIALYAGTGGMERSPLYDGTSQVAYATSILLPSEFAPMNSDWPTVTGTTRRAMSVMKELVSATEAIEDEGYEVGYALLDLSTGIKVAYNADSSFYSASSIKGPYVTSVVKNELGSSVTSEQTRISNILEYSDNAAYSTFRDAYGNTAFQSFVAQSGADQMPSTGANEDVAAAAKTQSGDSIADNKYEFFTPNQMLALWQESYDFLSSNQPGASWLASEFEKPETSAIRVTASSLGTTWSKAGWYPADTAGYGTTVDAGAVRTDDGDFLIVVMSTAPEDFTAMETIVSPLVTLRAALTA